VRNRLALAVLALGLGLAACSSTTNNSTANSGDNSPYRIVVVAGVSQTGTAALNAKAAVQSAKAAADVLNKSGGVLGHKVEVEVLDDQGQPTVAVTKLQQRLQTGEKPNLVMPGNTSNEALATVPIATSAKVLVTTQAASATLNDPKKFPNTFSVTPPPDTWAQALLDYVKSKGKAKIAMLYGEDAFGSTVGAAVKAAVPGSGVTLTGSETYKASDLDVTAQLQRLRGGNPDFLYVQGFGAVVGHVLDNRVKLGWTGTPVIGDSTVGVTSLMFTTPAQGGLLGTQDLQNVVVQTHEANVYSSSAPPALQTLIDALKGEGSITLPLNAYSGYDAIMLAAYAAEQAKSITDVDKQTKALETDLSTVNSPKWGLTSRYKYSATAHAPVPDPKIVQTITPTALVDGQYGRPGS
jgi:branched-chain amino acid transport system substrate-binding protein